MFHLGPSFSLFPPQLPVVMLINAAAVTLRAPHRTRRRRHVCMENAPADGSLAPPNEELGATAAPTIRNRINLCSCCGKRGFTNVTEI